MDDNTFDKRIKEKVEKYKDTGADDGALAGLHEKMSGVTYTRWYTPYRKIAGYTTAVLLTSLLNFGLFTYFQTSRDEALRSALTELKENKISYNRLKEDFKWLRASKTDTIYIFKKVKPHQNIPDNSWIREDIRQTELPATALPPDGEVNLGKAEEISDEIKQFLGQYGLAYLHENGNIYLRNHNIEQVSFIRRKSYQEDMAANNATIQIKSVNNELNKETVKAGKKTSLSVKVLREIEKQKMTGIGFQYGPEVDAFKLATDVGHGKPGISAGIMGEFILSPALRIETGAKYMLSAYKISAVNQLSPDQLLLYPAIEQEAGTLESISVTDHAVLFPVHLKYNYPIARDRYLFVSAGVSPQLFLTQFINYSYQYDIDTGGEDDFGVAIEASKRVDDIYFNPGTIDAGIGIEKKLKNHAILQLSAFYSYGLKPVGTEEREFKIFGLRSALKFRIK